MTIRQIQQAVAASSDELLAVTKDISDLLPLYGKIKEGVFRIKRQLLEERCRRLDAKLTQVCEELDRLEREGVRQEGISITGQLLAQNRVVLSNHLKLLSNLAEHADTIQETVKLTRELEIRALTADLQRRLQKELAK